MSFIETVLVAVFALGCVLVAVSLATDAVGRRRERHKEVPRRSGCHDGGDTPDQSVNGRYRPRRTNGPGSDKPEKKGSP